jgi:hypothetical protein
VGAGEVVDSGGRRRLRRDDPDDRVGVPASTSSRPTSLRSWLVNQIDPSRATATSVGPVPVNEPEQGVPTHGVIGYST